MPTPNICTSLKAVRPHTHRPDETAARRIAQPRKCEPPTGGLTQACEEPPAPPRLAQMLSLANGLALPRGTPHPMIAADWRTESRALSDAAHAALHPPPHP